MRRCASLLLIAAAGFAVPALAASGTTDGATIVDSGSTNALGYKIQVWTNGNATLTLQNRGGAAVPNAAKPFATSKSTVARLFADLKAARDGNARGVPCMKSASFGTTTHVFWHGWTSPDLDCPAGNALTAALVHDVAAIRAASGVETMRLHRGVMPIRPIAPPAMPVSPEPSPVSSPTFA